MRGVVGMRRVFACIFVPEVRGRRNRSVRIEARCSWHILLRRRCIGLGRCMIMIMIMAVQIVSTIVVVMTFMVMIMLMTFMIVMIRVGRMMFGIVRVDVAAFAMLMVGRLRGLRWIGSRTLDDLALHAIAIAATTRIAMPRTAAVGTVFGFFLGLAMGALVGFDQSLTVGDRDLIIVGMDFAEGQKTVAVAAPFDGSPPQPPPFPPGPRPTDISA